MFACVDLNTSTPTAGRPFKWRRSCSSGLTSSTCATSPMRTLPLMTRLRMSSSVRNSPIGRTESRSPCAVIWPALTEKLLRSSSETSRCISMPWAAMRPASTRMRTSRGSTPASTARATPSMRSIGFLR